MGGGREQDLGDDADGAATWGVQRTSWLQSRLSGQQLLKQIDYKYLDAEYAYYSVPYFAQAFGNISYGRLDLPPLYLHGIKLQSVEQDVHHPDYSACTGDGVQHSFAGKGSGVVGYAPYFFVATTDVLYKIHAAAYLLVFVGSHVQSAGPRRSHEVYGLLVVVGADCILPDPAT